MKMRDIMGIVESAIPEEELGPRLDQARRDLAAASEKLRAARNDPDFTGSLVQLDDAREEALAAFNAAEDAIGNHFKGPLDAATSMDEVKAILARIPRSVAKSFAYDHARQRGFDVRFEAPKSKVVETEQPVKKNPLKALSDEELTQKYRSAIVSTETARMRFAKNRSPKNGDSFKRASARQGALRTEMSLRNLPTSRF